MRILSVDPGRKNLCLCIVDINETETNGVSDVILFWNLSEIPTHVKSLRDALDALLADVAYDEVVIERQPPRNSTMKRLEHLFEMYFAVHDKPVCVFDPRHKLAFAAKTPFWEAHVSPTYTSYAQRKKLSVGVVTRFLEATKEQNASFHGLFTKAKKKDDYSDSLLQAQAFAHMVRVPKKDVTTKGVTPKAPKPGYKRITKANVAYLLKTCVTAEDVDREIKNNVKLRRALERHYGHPESFITCQSAQHALKKCFEGHSRIDSRRCPSPTPPSSD